MSSFCGYCRSTKGKKSNCSGCKKICYCNKDCQTKHWHLIHKKQCKKIRKNKYPNYHPNDEQKELESLFHQWERYADIERRDILCHELARNKPFQEMMYQREVTKQNETPEEELLFPVDDGKEAWFITCNKQARIIFDAFDKDGDRKLNFKEFCSVLKVLNFDDEHSSMTMDKLWKDVIIKSHKLDEKDAVNPKQFRDGLGAIAYLMSKVKHFHNEGNPKHDFFESFDPKSETEFHEKSFFLMIKLYGHALTILNNNFDEFDNVYNVRVGMHNVQYVRYENDEKELWNIYDREKKDAYYDLYYVTKYIQYNGKDINMLYLLFKVCNDTDQCDTDINKVENHLDSLIGNYERVCGNKLCKDKRYILASLPAYIVNNSMSMQLQSLLIQRLLETHKLNPALCHSLYIGMNVYAGSWQRDDLVETFSQPHEHIPPNFGTLWKKCKVYRYNDEFDNC